MKKFNLLALAAICTLFTQAQTVATFENLTLPADSFENGEHLTGSFTSGKAVFLNDYNANWQAWSGFAYSNITDDTTQGSDNQYGSITGGGYASSATFAVANGYGNTQINLSGNAAGGYVKGFYITNSAYAYYSMQNGDQFAKKFGGVSGNDADWFKLTITGWLNGAVKQQSVDFMLADYTFADNNQDYLVDDWQWLNLQPLGNVDSLQFTLTSSDTGQFGMNTPAYFILDNFTTADVANVAPTASNDAATTNYNTAVTINVLANDFDTTATPLTVTTTGAGLIAGSTVTVDGSNNLVYTPAVGIVATDTVSYSVCDDAGLCANAKAIINVTGITGIEDIIAANVNVYPNPFGSQLHIQANEGLREVALYDLNGRQMEVAINLSGNKASINTLDIAAGTYIVKATSTNGTSYRKVSKQ